MIDYPTPARALTPSDLELVGVIALRRLRSIKPSTSSWEQGMAWYEQAHQFCRDLSEIVSHPVDRLCWALAALSPLNHWHRNKIDLVDLVTTGDCAALGPCRTKARRVLAGEPVSEVIGGNKVKAFGDNIANPETSRAVTLDSHMAKALELPGEFKYLERAGVYDTIAGVIKRSARGRGIAPHQLQATLWIEARGKSQ